MARKIFQNNLYTVLLCDKNKSLPPLQLVENRTRHAIFSSQLCDFFSDNKTKKAIKIKILEEMKRLVRQNLIFKSYDCKKLRQTFFFTVILKNNKITKSI